MPGVIPEVYATFYVVVHRLASALNLATRLRPLSIRSAKLYRFRCGCLFYGEDSGGNYFRIIRSSIIIRSSPLSSIMKWR